MTDAPHHSDQTPNGDDRLEAFLDGLLDDRQRAEFARQVQGNADLRQQAELQARIDAALRRLFHVETPTLDEAAATLAGAGGRPTSVRRGSAAPAPADAPVARSARRYWTAAVAAAAAVVLWALLAGPFRQRDDGPHFVARPLVEIYRDAVAAGFEPTYECREPERFAATFDERQGRPLQLLDMPEGSRMLGLAYVGGLSRQTTAMLCLVDGQPVMAFVDRAESDQPHAADATGTNLRVFRQERDGLVFYEVTPLDEPRVLKFLTTPPSAGAL